MEASNSSEDPRRTPSRSTTAAFEINNRWDQIEKEAEEMGYIPKRSSLARTPDKKRKNSSPSIIGIRDDEDLDRSFREINKEEKTTIKTTKRYKTNNPNPQETMDTEKEKNQNKTETRHEKTDSERIKEIKNARALIIEATNKMSAGKIQFNRTEQSTVQVQVEIMTNHLINLLEKMANKKEQDKEKYGEKETNIDNEIRKMHLENRRQQQEIWRSLNKVEKTLAAFQEKQKKNSKRGVARTTNTTEDDYTARSSSGSESEYNEDTDTGKTETRNKQKKALKKTYAQAIGNTQRKTNTEKTEPWKTPEHTPKYEAIIRPKENEDARDTIKKIKEIAKNELRETGGLKEILKVPTGSVVLKFKSKEQQTKITEKIRKDKTIDIKEGKRISPKLQITGIGKGLTDEDIRAILLEENEEIMEELGENWTEDLEIVTRRTCRNRLKENVVINTNLRIFKTLVKRQRIRFELMMLHVEELTEIPLCFKCSSYGHVAKHCLKTTEKCYKCSGEHAGKDCNNSRLNCTNCKRQKLPGISAQNRADQENYQLQQR